MIVQAACRIRHSGFCEINVIPLHRHGDIGKILKEFGYRPGVYEIIEQGFLDEHGLFYSRHEALKEALRCKQPLIGELKDELFSENLY